MCLDVLRALGKSLPQAREALEHELMPACALDARFAAYAGRLLDELPALIQDEGGARGLAERLVLAVQGALLLRHAPSFVAEAFVASRIAQAPGGAFGRLPAGIDCAAILARSLAA
jgi:putative acyl-CoA dehydrogenase